MTLSAPDVKGVEWGAATVFNVAGIFLLGEARKIIGAPPPPFFFF